VANPASYANLGAPTFDVGLSTSYLRLTSGDAVQDNSDAYFRYAALAIPLMTRQPAKKKRLGFAFGVLPYSKVGYTVLQPDSLLSGDQVTYRYDGEGGVSQIFLGGGMDFRLDTGNVHRMGVGFNATYMFGPIDQTRLVLFDDQTANGLNTRILQALTIRDLYFDFGLNYSWEISRLPETQEARAEGRSVILGAALTFAPQQAVATETRNFIAATSGELGTEFVRDTLLDVEDKGDLTIPLKIGGGLSLQVYDQWLFALDFTSQNWANYEVLGVNQGLSSRNEIAFGAQFRPDAEAPAREFFKLMQYRAGVRFADTRLKVNGENLGEYGINFGLGIPLVRSGVDPRMIRKGVVSAIQIGVEFGQRGRNSDGLIREQFFNVNVGFSFAPNKFDQWFRKRRID
ncbi:MAG: hypothetical protein AAGB22_13265, partial [Bacteroidota bacterium]